MKVAPDTYLIPNLAAAEPGAYVPVNSLVILGEEPIIVDTGAPVHREHWLEMVYGLVDPDDIRWVFLSHEDGDHTGSLDQVLEAAPPGDTRHELLQHRTPGPRAAGAPRAHDLARARRDLRRRGPSPAARPAADLRRPRHPWPLRREDRRAVSVDAFAALTTGAVHHVEELPEGLYHESFMFFNSLVSPWHQFLDPDRYNRHVDTVEALKPSAIASAHGPILIGDAIHDAFDRVRTLAGEPIIAPPGQAALDEILAATTAAAA